MLLRNVILVDPKIGAKVVNRGIINGRQRLSFNCRYADWRNTGELAGETSDKKGKACPVPDHIRSVHPRIFYRPSIGDQKRVRELAIGQGSW